MTRVALAVLAVLCRAATITLGRGIAAVAAFFALCILSVPAGFLFDALTGALQ